MAKDAEPAEVGNKWGIYFQITYSVVYNNYFVIGRLGFYV